MRLKFVRCRDLTEFILLMTFSGTNSEFWNYQFFSRNFLFILICTYNKLMRFEQRILKMYKLIFVNKFRICKFRIRCLISWTLHWFLKIFYWWYFFYKNSQFALFWKKLVVTEFRNGCGYVMSKIIIQKVCQNTRFLFFWLCKFVILKVGGLFLRAGGYWLQFHIFFL